MGELVEGIWRGRHAPPSKDGRFVRGETQFRHWVTADGSAGPTGEAGFKAEPGRYHLYVSLACPWAHRTLIIRSLKGLEDAIGVSVVHWHMRRAGLDVRGRPGRHRRPPARFRLPPSRSTPRPGPTTPGGSGAGAVGPGAADHRQQRIGRDHPDAERRVRSGRRAPGRLLSGHPAARDRRAQRAGLRRTSTTASTRPASRARRQPTRRPSAIVRDARLARGHAVIASAT